MLKELLTELFDKLKSERENDNKSKHGSAVFFVEKVLEERFNLPSYINPRTIKSYYEKYVEKRINAAGEPSNELKNLIAKYLGYEDFLDFENNYSSVSSKQGGKPSFDLMKIFTLMTVLIMSALGFYYVNKVGNDNECLEWRIDHYEKIKCIGNEPDLRLQDIDIDKFKRVSVSDTTTFFIEGHPIIWYGKSKAGDMEYFNSRGIHPETKEELKPITEYIIRKYIFEE